MKYGKWSIDWLNIVNQMNIEQYVVKCKVQLKVQLKWVEYLEVVNKLEYVLQVDRKTGYTQV